MDILQAPFQPMLRLDFIVYGWLNTPIRASSAMKGVSRPQLFLLLGFIRYCAVM